MRTRVGGSVAAAALVAVATAATIPNAHAGGPALDKPPFTAAPAELLAEAKAAPAGAWSYVVLRHDEDLAADEQGRYIRRHRAVIVLQDQAAVDDWATLHWRWSPSHQDRLRVRARALAPTGAEAPLDPALMSDAPDAEAPSIATDRRVLSAPLPKLQIGSVLEYEVTETDRAPWLPGGNMAYVRVGSDGVPTQSTRIVLSAPARRARQLAHEPPGGARPVHKLEQGRESWTYTFGALPPAPDLEPHVPGDGPDAPYVALSTAPSWSAVARAYRQLADRRIAEGAAPYPAGVPRAATLEAVRALTAWLHRTVRPTGIGLWQAAAAPRTPAETVRLGAGDHADRALLLVALLRQAGLRAELALIDTAPGRDAEPDLPGMQWFDRPLVRVHVGTRPLWIDLTDDLLPPGRLPADAQGRRALVIDAATTALAPTPAAAPADNLIRHVRTFELSEQGEAARVIEVHTMGGVFESAWRRALRDTPPDELRSTLEAVAFRGYGGTLASHRATAFADLSTPLAITLESTGARAAFTARSAIWISMRPGELLYALPAFLRDPDPSAARRTDLQWLEPYAMEIENRYALPPGFTAPTLPADQTTALGPASLVERHRLEGRTLVVTLRFDTGKTRIAPLELAMFRRALPALQERWLRIDIERTAARLSKEGKPREAIAEVERLIRLHPKEAVHHMELAMAYGMAGMGIAARRAARRAVELEPSSVEAQLFLASVLERDSLGRDHGFDHDRAGALAAYARARQLAPAHASAALGLGELLRRDARGFLLVAPPEQARALEALRAAFAGQRTETPGLALATALVAGGAGAGALAEAERVLRALDAGPVRDALLVAAAAAGPGGAAAADRLAGELRPAGKQALLDGAARQLLHARRYDELRALIALGAAPPSILDAAAAQRIARIQPRPLGRDPKGLATELDRMRIDGVRDPAAFWDAQTAAELADMPMWDVIEIPREVIGDLLRATTEVTAAGGDALWRVEVRTLSSGRAQIVYGALDRGAVRILGTRERAAGVARHVQRLAAAGDLASAGRGLDWLLQDGTSAAVRLGKVWGPGLPRDAGAVALAAAVFAGTADADRALANAARCASSSPDARDACDETIARVLRDKRRWRELEAHAAAWLARAPARSMALVVRIEALAELGRFEEADRAQAAAAAALPQELSIAKARPRIALQRRDYAEAIRRYEDVLHRPDADADAQNEAAWLRLFTGADLSGALALAQQASGPDRTKAGYGDLHTLAAVEAELGKLTEAKVDAWQAMENIGRAAPATPDWYMYGRLAEGLGLRDDAIAAYRRTTDDSHFHHDSYELAQLRLRKLGATP